MDHIQGPARAILITNLRQYLLEDLTDRNAPAWVGEWNKTSADYHRVMQRTLRQTCSVCVGYATLNISQHIMQTQSADEWRSHLERNLQIPADARTQIDQCAGSPIIKCIILRLRVRYWTNGGHAAFFLFDTRRRLQFFFDMDDFLLMNDGTPRIKSFATGFGTMRVPILPGFKVVPPPSLAWGQREQSMQRVFESGAEDVGLIGQCGILSQLVIMCCVRFCYWNPKDMADMIMLALPTPPDRINFVHVFITWYDDVSRPRLSATDFEEKVHPPSSTGCPCFSWRTGRLCTRPSCREGNHIYCWQHRHMIRNPLQRQNKKCATSQLTCQRNGSL